MRLLSRLPLPRETLELQPLELPLEYILNGHPNFGGLLSNATNMSEAFANYLHYRVLIGNVDEVSYKREKDNIEFTYDLDGEGRSSICAYGNFSIMVKLAKLYEPTGVRVKLLELSGKPFAKGAWLKDDMQCPVNFGSEKNRMILHAPGVLSTARTQNKFLQDFFVNKAEQEISHIYHDRRLCAKIERLLDEEIAQGNLLVSDIAPLTLVCEKMELSRWNLHRRLIREGENFQTILRRVRLREARRQLLRTEAMVSHISDSLGFSSVSVFSRFFSEQMGISPTRYRENHPRSG